MSRCSSELRLFWLSLIVVTFVAGCVDGDAHPLMDASTPSGSGGSAAGSGGMPATNDGSGGAALGDKDAGLVGPSWSADVYPLLVAGCGGCHGDEAEKFNRSLHGDALKHGKFLAPTCMTCHGKHNILPATNPKAKTYTMNIPSLVSFAPSPGK